MKITKEIPVEDKIVCLVVYDGTEPVEITRKNNIRYLDGATLKYLESLETYSRISIKISKRVNDYLDKRAVELEMSKSDFIEQLVKNDINNKGYDFDYI